MYELLGPLILFAAVMSLTPGPNVIMVTASAANFGFRRTVPQIIGITLGFGLLVMAAGLGVAGLVRAEPRLHAVLRYAGAAYLLYLAWRVAHADPAGTTAARSRPIGPLLGALLTWLNPKGWVFALGAVTAFTTAGSDLMWQTAVIAAVNATACGTSLAIWAGFGTLIGRVLHHGRARRLVNGSMAGLLVLSLVPVFL